MVGSRVDMTAGPHKLLLVGHHLHRIPPHKRLVLKTYTPIPQHALASQSFLKAIEHLEAMCIFGIKE